jgi:hypothetical protein
VATSETALHCLRHGEEFEATRLVTGVYSFCVSCSIEETSRKSTVVRESFEREIGFMPTYIANGIAFGPDGESAEWASGGDSL